MLSRLNTFSSKDGQYRSRALPPSAGHGPDGSLPGGDGNGALPSVPPSAGAAAPGGAAFPLGPGRVALDPPSSGRGQRFHILFLGRPGDPRGPVVLARAAVQGADFPGRDGPRPAVHTQVPAPRLSPRRGSLSAGWVPGPRSWPSSGDLLATPIPSRYSSSSSAAPICQVRGDFRGAQRGRPSPVGLASSRDCVAVFPRVN